jgi:hypothetical protein
MLAKPPHNIIVVEAAGNGAEDLDGVTDVNGQQVLTFNGPHDTGAIIVGASFASVANPNAPGHYRADQNYVTESGSPKLGWGIGSSYGPRVDCYAWGQNVVTTKAAGKHTFGGDTPRSKYGIFGGTTAASSIIAGAALCVQSAAKKWQKLVTPQEMRTWFRDQNNGTAQADTSIVPGKIGVMPDLKKILSQNFPLPAVTIPGSGGWLP